MSYKAASLFILLVIGLISDTARSQEILWKTYLQAGLKAQQQGRYADAQKQLQAAASEALDLGETDSRLGQTLNLLATVEQGLAHYEKAESYYKRARAIAEKNEGAASKATVTSLINLASLYQDQARF